MLITNSRPRRGHLLLWASASRVLIFACLAVAIWSATRTRFDADPRLLEALGFAEFLEELARPASEDWPEWRGPRRDGVAVVKKLATQWPSDGPKVLWEKDISGSQGYSAFAVVAGRAYTLLRDGGNEVIVCWNMKDGGELWRKTYPSGIATGDTLGGYPGTRSTPTVHDGRVYTVGAAGRFQCREAETGDLLWEKDLLKEYAAQIPHWGIAFSPLIDGDLVFTSPGGSDGKSLVAFDRISGEERWRSQDDPAGYSSPMAITVDGERQVVFFTGAGLVGVAAKDGALRWRFPWETPNGVNAATPIPFRALIDGKEQHFVFISSGYGKGCALVGLVRQNGGGHKALRVFESNKLCSHFGSPIRVGDHVYGFNETNLVCLSLRTGQQKWKKSGFKKGTVLVVNDHLLVLGEEGKLALMTATPEEPKFVAEAGRTMSGRYCWTMPVLAGTRLLLRDEGKVRCLELGEEK